MPRRLLVPVVGLLLLVGGCKIIKRALQTRDIPDVATIAVALRKQVTSDQHPDYATAREWKLMQEVYRKRDFVPLWADPIGPRDRARDLVDALCAADSQALRPRDYALNGLADALTRAYHSDSVTAGDLADADLRLTQLFLDYGRDLLAGRIDPTAVDTNWYIRTRRKTVDSTLAAALTRRSFDDMVKPLAPTQPDYEALAGELQHYRAIDSTGGWARVPPGPALHTGSRGVRVAALKRRLAATGDLAPGDSGGRPVFDRNVAEAVKKFQARHGLKADGAAGGGTLDALNVPVGDRIRQIEINLERLRWLPNSFGDRYVLVNIPDYQLTAYDQGKPAFSMKVIVGEEYKATPVFADSMSYIVFRPRWNVPSNIAKTEMIPAIRANPGYLARQRLEVVDSNDKVVDPRKVDWDADTADFHYRLRQEPGPNNSLGLIKFMFPNQFAIYLHDTPAGYLFDRNSRAFSHGCVRVSQPVELANWVLSGQDDWDQNRIRHAMRTDSAGKPKVVQLEHRVPVYLVYLTAFERDGVVQFRDDIYGMDQRAERRIRPAVPDSATRSRCERLRRLIRP